MLPSITRRAALAWAGVAPLPADPILGLVAAFKEDPAPTKVNVAQGAYRTDEGAPFVLPSVQEAERRIAAKLAANESDKEYLPIEGCARFRALAARMVLGEDSAALAAGRVATLQTISGTGALSVAAAALRRVAGVRALHVSDPSWGNHAHIFRTAGLDVVPYRYLDDAGTGLDFGGMRSALAALPAGSAVLLHACAHNPTGVDPTPAQWEELAALFADRGLLPVLDSAYQGYASGDLAADAFSVRAFEKACPELVVCQSFAKSMGLYGERIGAVNFVCATGAEADAVLSQVKQTVVRPVYSSPPLHGARLVAEVLEDAALSAQWEAELLEMSGRVGRMREGLADALRAVGAPAPDGGDWGHITSQIGMFAFTGLSASHVDALRERWHVYMTRDGRMSMAGLQPGQIGFVAEAMNAVLS